MCVCVHFSIQRCTCMHGYSCVFVYKWRTEDNLRCLSSGSNNLITRTGSLDGLELKKEAMINFLQTLVFCLPASPAHREPAHTIIPGMFYMGSGNLTDVRLLAWEAIYQLIKNL